MLVRPFVKVLKRQINASSRWIFRDGGMQLTYKLVRLNVSSVFSIRMQRLNDHEEIRFSKLEQIYLWNSIKRRIGFIKHLRILNKEAVTLNVVEH